ncbi:MAG: hypothetical protein WC807_02190 [Hyphomicrobium sp.]
MAANDPQRRQLRSFVLTMPVDDTIGARIQKRTIEHPGTFAAGSIRSNVRT